MRTIPVIKSNLLNLLICLLLIGQPVLAETIEDKCKQLKLEYNIPVDKCVEAKVERLLHPQIVEAVIISKVEDTVTIKTTAFNYLLFLSSVGCATLLAGIGYLIGSKFLKKRRY